MPAENLPFADDEFELATAIEVLEHVPDPEHTLAEMARCASTHLLVSVPREPLWRMLNMARGAYWRRARQHARASQPLVAALVRAPALRATERSSRCARRSPGRCCLSASRASSSSQPASAQPAPTAPAKGRSYGSGARILSIGIASTGLLTFAYFSIASHVLSGAEAKRIDLLWSVMFVIISVIYRPIEQLLSRTIADRRARGHAQHTLRVPMLIQASFALLFLALALGLKEQLLDVFDHNESLYWILVVGTLAYAASYFARGWLAGHERFGLFGGLVLMESFSRLCFALAVAVGIASGETAVALGIAAAPLVSLVVVPAAFARRTPIPVARGAPITVDEADAALAGPGTEGVQETAAHEDLTLRRGGLFAVWVSAIMLSEQTLLNAAVLTVDATAKDVALAGIVFNVLLIARAPLQLFQAIQTSLLPHLTGLEATAGHEAFSRAIRITVLAIAAFAGGGRDRPAGRRPVLHAARAVRAGLRIRALGPRTGRRRHGAAPDLGRAQPGRAGARPRPCSGVRAGCSPRWCSSAGCSRR